MPVYLGDSVYADFDGFHIVLSTNNGEGPSNTIYMEPAVMDELWRYQERIAKAIQGKTSERQ
ncbi:MAG: hypothetical protein ACYC35_00415 [Pirellulales bacterium]|jgi:hypothetical protein